MSQHDLDIANQGFPATRADINNALQALGSLSSGATAPATTYANQLWYDTANNIIKIRNEDNDAWISLMTLDQAGGLVKRFDVDNIRIDGNTISSTNTNGDITLDPAGTGSIVAAQVASSSLDIEGDRTDAQITLKGGSAGAGIQLFGSTYTNYAGAMYLDATASTTGTNDAQMIFRTGSTPSEAMRIDSSGHVQIQSGASTGNLVFKESSTDSWSIRNNGANGYLAFYDDYNNAERMRIDNSGNVLVGDSSVADGNNNTCTIASGGTIHTSRAATNAQSHHIFYNPNGSVGQIYTSGSSTIYATSSDYRLKEAVVDMTGAIDRVKALAPKRFNFIADADTTVDGFLAHEAQSVVPEAISGTHNEVDENGDAVMQGIDQSKLVPLLTGALQEAIAKIETLETKVAALEAAE